MPGPRCQRLAGLVGQIPTTPSASVKPRLRMCCIDVQGGAGQSLTDAEDSSHCAVEATPVDHGAAGGAASGGTAAGGSVEVTLPLIPSTALQWRGCIGEGSFGMVSKHWWSGHGMVAVKANGVVCADRCVCGGGVPHLHVCGFDGVLVCVGCVVFDVWCVSVVLDGSLRA